MAYDYLDEKRPTTVQQTQRHWKAGMAVGVVMMLLGVPACLSSLGGPHGPSTLALFLLDGGLATTVVSRLAAWWTTG